MERPQYGLVLIFSFILTLCLLSFALCIASEFKKSKKEDLRLVGKMCYLPQSGAFGLGVSALVCLIIGQTIGNVIICKGVCSRERRRNKCKPTIIMKPSIPSLFQVLSWISFGIAVILMGTATSMNGRQPLGEGWLDGDCYLVKNGVFAGSGILSLVAVGSTLALAGMRIREAQDEKGRDQRIYAQAESGSSSH